MQPLQPLHQSQIPMPSSQYYPGTASLPKVQSLDLSAPAFLASSGSPGTSATSATSATGPRGPDVSSNDQR